MKKILITGGTGFIGANLIPYLTKIGFEIAVLSRGSQRGKLPNVTYYLWDIKKRTIDPEALKNVDYIINLAGANIGAKNWTDERKKILLNSRVVSTNFLYDSVVKFSVKPKCIISSSAVGYYGTFNSDKILTEDAPKGNDFLAEVCHQWEMAAHKFEKLGARTVILRKGVVIGKDGGIVDRMAGIAKFGLNTSVGSGKQFIPWIAMQDLVRLYFFVLEQPSMTGVFNAVSGEHINMNEFAKALSKAMNKPILTPNAPAFAIKMLYGKMSIMLLNGSRVSHEKLKNEGFEFKYRDIQEVLNEVFKKQ